MCLHADNMDMEAAADLSASPSLQSSEFTTTPNLNAEHFSASSNTEPNHTALTTRVMSLTRYDLLRSWRAVNHFGRQGTFTIDGEALKIGHVVAMARYSSRVEIKLEATIRVDESVQALGEILQAGDIAYGVNTGFGGSSDSRSNAHSALQLALLQMMNCGVLPLGKKELTGSERAFESHKNPHSMPKTWVKAAMLIRLNTLIRGHSGVSMDVLEKLRILLNDSVTPVIPLRGSISASGDLCPLSYLAGLLQGNPEVLVHVERDQIVVPANEALAVREVAPAVLAPKEGLSLINGTAVSAGVAALALYDTRHIALLAQAMTCMATEALKGDANCFHSFICQTKYAAGQVEALGNIYKGLKGSKLARGMRDYPLSFDLDASESSSPSDGEENDAAATSQHGPSVGTHNDLAQDRYAIRTAGQWIGPLLEDLDLAQLQIEKELNSTTDNPLIDAQSQPPCLYSGGNFQASSITSATEKNRRALQMLGKLMFAQCSELINPMMSNGLPANLAPDDPSLSFLCKGIDIAMASYMSELAYLANPVSNHVQSAEMHNQSINSLALISARKTVEAVDLVHMMCASYLFVLCQALDLRVLQDLFLKEAKGKMKAVTEQRFAPCNNSSPKLSVDLWACISQSWSQTANNDLDERCDKAVAAAKSVLLDRVCAGQFDIRELDAGTQTGAEVNTTLGREMILDWEKDVKAMLSDTYTDIRARLFEEHIEITPKHLGDVSKHIYLCVRKSVGIGMHRGFVDYPTVENKKQAVGTQISRLYENLGGQGGVRGALMAVIKAWGGRAAWHLNEY